MKKRPLKERKRIASQGGKASGQAKRENRTYKNIAKILMQTTPSDKTFDAFKTRYPKISEEDKNLKVLMVLGQISRAVQGDTQAFKTIMELAPDEEDMTDNKQGINIDDFYACCEICGYPPPYPKQIEMADFIFDWTNEPRLLLGARNYGKTEYAVIVKAAQMIAQKGVKIVLATKEQDRVKDLALEIGRCLECLGVKDFKRKSSKVIQLENNITKEPNLKAISLGSKGFRSRHPDFILMDDPITPEAAGKADRDKAKRVYDEALKLSQRVRLIGQPVHAKDLYQITRTKIKTMEVPYGTIPELDIDLEILRLAGVDEASINASYFLKIDEVSQMPFSKIEITDAKFDIQKGSIASIDPSHKGGDYTAITIAQGYFEKLLAIGFCFKKAWYDCLPELKGLAARFNIKQLFFENNALGEEPIRQLKTLIPACVIKGFESLDNKEAKIQNAGMFVKSILLSSESDFAYKTQTIEYEIGAKNDDAPDSLANLLININLMKSAKEKRNT